MSLLKELWPFISEIFLKNDELRKDISKPSFFLKFLLVIGIVVALIVGAEKVLGDVLVNSFNRSNMLSEELAKLEKRHSNLKTTHATLQGEVITLRQRNSKLEDELDDKKVFEEELEKSLEECETKKDSMVPNKPRVYVRPRVKEETHINDLLKELE